MKNNGTIASSKDNHVAPIAPTLNSVNIISSTSVSVSVTTASYGANVSSVKVYDNNNVLVGTASTSKGQTLSITCTESFVSSTAYTFYAVALNGTLISAHSANSSSVTPNTSPSTYTAQILVVGGGGAGYVGTSGGGGGGGGIATKSATLSTGVALSYSVGYGGVAGPPAIAGGTSQITIDPASSTTVTAYGGSVGTSSQGGANGSPQSFAGGATYGGGGGAGGAGYAGTSIIDLHNQLKIYGGDAGNGYVWPQTPPGGVNGYGVAAGGRGGGFSGSGADYSFPSGVTSNTYGKGGISASSGTAGNAGVIIIKIPSYVGTYSYTGTAPTYTNSGGISVWILTGSSGTLTL
jgi:hypothetical protein